MLKSDSMSGFSPSWCHGGLSDDDFTITIVPIRRPRTEAAYDPRKLSTFDLYATGPQIGGLTGSPPRTPNSGRIDFKPGANPSTTPFFEGGLHLNYSRWFYRTRPIPYRTPTEDGRWPDSIRRFAASGVLGGVPVRTPIGGPVACKSKVGSFRGS